MTRPGPAAGAEQSGAGPGDAQCGSTRPAGYAASPPDRDRGPISRPCHRPIPWPGACSCLSTPAAEVNR